MSIALRGVRASAEAAGGGIVELMRGCGWLVRMESGGARE
jgi:hypothetical protein